MAEIVSESAAPLVSAELAPRSESAVLLDRAEQAHRDGRFAQVRTLLAELGRSGNLTVAEQQRGKALRDRLRPDPFVGLLILACLILFVSVIRGFWR